MGDVLRSVDPDRRRGQEVRQHLDSGSLVPSETVVAVWREHVEGLGDAFDPDRDRLVLDGIPRDDEQVRLLQPHVSIESAIHLDCPDEGVLMDRIRERRDGRTDDRRDAVIRHRFQVYREKTAPLLRLLPAGVVQAVDASRSPVEVLHEVTGALEVLP
jgi:adenylate kinase